MNGQCKYITYVDSCGNSVAVIFDAGQSHKEMHQRLARPEIVGAGFVEIYKGEVVPYGDSYSLNVKPHEKDQKIIEKMLFSG